MLHLVKNYVKCCNEIFSADTLECEGSSTPARDNCLKQADTDSAFQEPSIAVSCYILLKELTVTSALSRPPPTKAVTLSFLRRPPTRATSATSPWMTRTTTLCVTETSRGCCSPARPPHPALVPSSYCSPLSPSNDGVEELPTD